MAHSHFSQAFHWNSTPVVSRYHGIIMNNNMDPWNLCTSGICHIGGHISVHPELWCSGAKCVKAFGNCSCNLIARIACPCLWVPRTPCTPALSLWSGRCAVLIWWIFGGHFLWDSLFQRACDGVFSCQCDTVEFQQQKAEAQWIYTLVHSTECMQY